jgi:steroid 5-alpha reductase family enzyme
MPGFNAICFAVAYGLAAMLVLGFLTWVVSFFKANVSIVDGMWSLLIFSGGVVYALVLPVGDGPRATIVLILAALWALRLILYITWRNHGQPEDHRYQAIRARNQPHFEWKSLYLVFVLQAVLAWIVSMSLLGGIAGDSTLGLLDMTGIIVVLFGVAFETIGDWQLACFKCDPVNAGRVMDQGLWHYTRHPNYFGECCVWWGFYFIACSAGCWWWTIVSPLLMSFLLLKVSGMKLLEKDIGERRPAYRDYITRTPAFFPWFPKGGL